MCGLAGIFDTLGTREIDRRRLQQMSAALAHRGPDGDGMEVLPGIGLAHRRLAIIDLAGGAQPLRARGGTLLVFNGEIYNFAALAGEVRDAGRAVTGTSDSEVLAELLDLRGADALPALEGMFAFAAFNPGDGSLLLARDRLGEKPLYWFLSPDGFLYFASEIDALLASGIVPAVIDPEAVAQYLLYGYVPDPGTIYRQVHKLSAGHYLAFQRGRPTAGPRQWWRLQMAPDPRLTFEDATEQLLPLLDSAVRDQMVSDRPIAAFLSGGVDSSAVVSAMMRTGSGHVNSWAMGFDDPRFDERAHARAVAERLGTQHHEGVVHLDPVDMLDVVGSVYGEPFADSSAVPTLLLCRLVGAQATVALSGDGGDEVFAGYGRYVGVLREAMARRLLPRAARRGLIAPLGSVYPLLATAPAPLRLKTMLQAVGEDQAAGYARAVSAVLPDRARALIAPALRGCRPESVVEMAIARSGTDDPVLQAQAADLATWLPGRMLVKVDRAAMACGLEVRPPLLDRRLVEWAARLPRTVKVRDGVGKAVLKAALATRLDPAALNRPKQGFGAPVDAWFRGASSLQARLGAATHWKESGYFDVDRVMATARRHAAGQGRHGQELWSVLAFDAFLTRDATARSRFVAGEMSPTTSSDARNVA